MNLDALFWWTGLVLWMAVAPIAVWLLVEMAWAVVVAMSWMRWSIAVMKEYGREPDWRQAHRVFYRRWLDFIGYRNDGNTQWQGTAGRWNGVGDWWVVPRKGDFHD